MAFSKSFLEEVKDRNDIGELISLYLPLKKAGSNLVGLCPFHSEKTPSFTVFPGPQNYYCFGCGAGGDVITFVMQTEGFDYPSAVEFLAKRAGLEVVEENSHKKPGVSKERIIYATREAARFFYAYLTGEQGGTARDYLKNRGISNLTIRRFGIGASPEGWDCLYKHLAEKGFNLEEMRAAFLVGLTKNNKPYDIFRNRLMFPVMDISGNVVAFSARRLNEEDERKYINTSDTPAFKKSRVLFGLNIAKNTKDRTLIICEGAMDAITLQQAGFSNACATLGTSITDSHARAVARIAKTVFLAYDVDKAGQDATERAISKLGEAGVTAKIIPLGSEAKDPDDFIKKYGGEAFKKLLVGAESRSEYEINRILAGKNLNSPDEKVAAAREICAHIATLGTKTEIEIYAKMASDKLKVNKDALLEDIARVRRKNYRKEKQKFTETVLRDAVGLGDKLNRDKARFSSAAAVEEKILALLIIRPDLAAEAARGIDETMFLSGIAKKAFSVFKEDFESGRKPDISGEVFTKDETAWLAKITAERERLDDSTPALLAGLVEKLKKNKETLEAEQKIAENPAEGLASYIDSLKKRKT